MYQFLDIHLFVRAILVGFALAIPIGPVGILCLRRTFKKGRLSGFLSWLGIVTADTFYATVVLFGMTFISSLIIQYEQPLKLFGCFALFYLAQRIFSEKSHHTPDVDSKSRLSDYLSTLWLTLAHPGSILIVLAFLSNVIPRVANNYHIGLFTLCGIFLGSVSSWLFVTHGIVLLQKKIKGEKLMVMINKIAGILIWFFALVLLVDFFLNLK